MLSNPPLQLIRNKDHVEDQGQVEPYLNPEFTVLKYLEAIDLSQVTDEFANNEVFNIQELLVG